jgi:hypothetical protein
MTNTLNANMTQRPSVTASDQLFLPILLYWDTVMYILLTLVNAVQKYISNERSISKTIYQYQIPS